VVVVVAMEMWLVILFLGGRVSTLRIIAALKELYEDRFVRECRHQQAAVHCCLACRRPFPLCMW
jgi:hypothetical protein